MATSSSDHDSRRGSCRRRLQRDRTEQLFRIGSRRRSRSSSARGSIATTVFSRTSMRTCRVPAGQLSRRPGQMLGAVDPQDHRRSTGVRLPFADGVEGDVGFPDGRAVPVRFSRAADRAASVAPEPSADRCSGRIHPCSSPRVPMGRLSVAAVFRLSSRSADRKAGSTRSRSSSERRIAAVPSPRGEPARGPPAAAGSSSSRWSAAPRGRLSLGLAVGSGASSKISSRPATVPVVLGWAESATARGCDGPPPSPP